MSEESECIPVPRSISKTFINHLSPNENLNSFLDKLDYCVDFNEDSSIWSKDKIIINSSRTAQFENLNRFFPFICEKGKKTINENEHSDKFSQAENNKSCIDVSVNKKYGSKKIRSTPVNSSSCKKLKNEKENSYIKEFGDTSPIENGGCKKRLFHSTALGKSHENLLLVEDDANLNYDSIIDSPIKVKESQTLPKIKKTNTKNEAGKLKENCDMLKSLKINNSIENENCSNIRSTDGDMDTYKEECQTREGYSPPSVRRTPWFKQFEKFVNSTPRS